MYDENDLTLWSCDGDESYNVWYDEQAISEFRNGDRLLFEFLEDNASYDTQADLTSRGLTIYDGGNIIVISRGKTFEERYAQWCKQN